MNETYSYIEISDLEQFADALQLLAESSDVCDIRLDRPSDTAVVTALADLDEAEPMRYRSRYLYGARQKLLRGYEYARFTVTPAFAAGLAGLARAHKLVYGQLLMDPVFYRDGVAIGWAQSNDQIVVVAESFAKATPAWRTYNTGQGLSEDHPQVTLATYKA